MSPSKREREYARRRYDSWQSRQHAKAARTHQLRKVAIVIASIAVVVAVIALVYAASRPDPDPVAVTPSATTSSATSSAAKNPCGPVTEASKEAKSGGKKAPSPSVAEDRLWTGTIKTTCGDLTIELDGAKAPQAVANFVSLNKQQYFDNTLCHRLVITGIYVLQCGDPLGTGAGGPGYSFGPIENAPSDDIYPAGTIAMARQSGKADSNGSQFFIVYKDSKIPSDTAGGYTIFGKVTKGLNTVKTVAAGGTITGSEQPARSIAIESVEIK